MTRFLSRRRLLAAAASLPIAQVSPALADAVNLAIAADSGTEAAPLVNRMLTEDLVNKAATELRLSLQLQFLDLPALQRMIQAILASQIQVGLFSSTSMIRLLAGATPVIPVALAGGGMDFPLMVPPDAPIHDLAGLEEKTVLTQLGADPQLVLMLMLKAQFGHDDVKKLRITLRDAASPADLGHPQDGVDAIAGSQPYGYAAERRGDLETLLFNDGTTGAAWIGTEGHGAGNRFRNFARTPLAPEAFYPHRLWWAVRQDFLQANADVVIAFLTANARAAAAVAAMPPERIIELGGAKWPGDVTDMQKLVDRILWRRRGWAWITEADIRTLIVLSGTRSMFERELKPADMMRLLKPAAPLLRKAWIISGARPSLAAFTDPDAEDARGPPLWDLDHWRL